MDELSVSIPSKQLSPQPRIIIPNCGRLPSVPCTMSIPVSLKWGKTTFNDQLSIQTGSSARTFKTEVHNLTGVPIDRQKLLYPKAWKGALKDDDNLPDNIKLPKGKTSIVVTLLGSAESLVEKPLEERPRFAEDMTAEEIWKATKASQKDDNEEDHDNVDIVALQKEAGMDRDDGKMERYQYNRLVTGLPQHQIDDMLASRKTEDSDNDSEQSTSAKPLLGEVAMTMGMELRRAYINSLAVLKDGTLISGLDDGHVQIWRRGQLVKDARHFGAKVDHVLPFPSSTVNDPSFVTAGDGSISLWNEEGNHLMQFRSYPGTTPASIAVGSVLGGGGTTKYLATCFRITREVDPNQFRLVPQNEAERQRREADEAQEHSIQAQLARTSSIVKVWFYDGNRISGVEDAVGIASTSEDDTASITNLLAMDSTGQLVCADSWGGIRAFEWTQESTVLNSTSLSRRQCAFMQFRDSSIACMEQLDEDLLAVSIQPEQNGGVLPSAFTFTVTRPRAVYIVDITTSTMKVVLDAHNDTVQCLCRLSDGGLLTAGGKMDATVKVWDTLQPTVDESNSGDEIQVLTEAKTMKEPGYVFDLKVLPDSKGSGVYAIAAARYNVIKIVI